MKRAAYYLCAPLVCLALFWRVLFTWFRTDDFGLLGLASTVHDLNSLGYALFHPVAQGTVRVLSDRLFYSAQFLNTTHVEANRGCDGCHWRTAV